MGLSLLSYSSNDGATNIDLFVGNIVNLSGNVFDPTGDVYN